MASGEIPDFETLPENVYELPVVNPDWISKLARTNKGILKQNLDNVIRCIENDPELQDHIWYDEFLDAICTDWQGVRRKWRDSDDIMLQLYMQRYIGMDKISASACHDAAHMAAMRNVKNECQEWLKSLQWDDTCRLAYLMSEGFGAANTPYTQAVGLCFILSMVNRVMNPGCKVDSVPVFEGGQGIGKSTALGILGGKWFVECHESVLTKDFYGVLDGHMLVEISEMHSFTRSEVERVKGIISCQVDRYRRAYGRNTEDHPRQTVLACTTNRDDWQRDDTGARRFLPILCGEINLEWLRNNRDNLFAEAMYLFTQDAPWWNIPEDEQRHETERRREVDPWEDAISKFLIGKTEITLPEIAIDCLKIEQQRFDTGLSKRIARILRMNGWKLSIQWINGKTTRKWVSLTLPYA